jgi:copper(I)-binding protein
MNRLVAFSAAVAALLALAAPAFAHDGVTHVGAINIYGEFSRATLPRAPVGGGYLTIENTGTETDRLVSVTSPVSPNVQIHEMKMEGEVMKMRALKDGIEIAPGATVELTPGGSHVMFMGIKAAFVEGETVPVTLTFEKAGSVELELPVLGAAAASAEADHSSH